jgi:hypothetical protein
MRQRSVAAEQECGMFGHVGRKIAERLASLEE